MRHQAADGLDAILSPRSVAVVGASPDPTSVGHALLRSIVEGGFAGPVYPVHPRAKEILGLRAYTRVEDLPEPPQLAVLAVPAAAVIDVAETCGRKGVKGLLVVSAGFKEADEEGAHRQDALLAIVRRYGMRMMGPNCLGVINNSPGTRLHATFAPRRLLSGSTALVTQSGAIGIALMEHAAKVGLGVSRFVSMGNKADVSGNDLLLLWENDPEVKQVLLYLENFGNPRNFVKIAKRITRTKPVVMLKGGRTAKGARAAGSHTAALMQSDVLVDALLEQCGVLRAQSVEELFDIATAFAAHGDMAGNRVAIVTNSGGPAILAVDALEASGLEPADFSPSTLQAFRAFLPAASHATNPIDLLAGGTPEAFEACLRACLADPGVDGVIAIWTPLQDDQRAQADAIGRALAGAAKPGVAVTFGHGPGTPAFEALKEARVPCFTFPENAVRSMAALRAAGVWRGRPEERPAVVQVQNEAARAIVTAAKPMDGGWLAMRDAFALLASYGVNLPTHAWIERSSEVAEAAKGITFPAVLKVEAPGLIHKTEAGAVRVGIQSAALAAEAYAAAVESVRSHGYEPSGAVLMETIAPAPEVLVGATQDRLFGPLVACGAGGIYTEILRDVQFRLAPMSVQEAHRTVQRLRLAPLLAGARGQPASDVAALEDVLVRVGQLAADFPHLAEIEANPVRVMPRGVVALDVRIRVASEAT